MKYRRSITESENTSKEDSSKKETDTVKIIMIFVLILIFIIYFTGIYKYIPKSKFAVMREVKETVTGENYELISEERIEDDYPRTIRYVFRSTERNLEFDAYSTYCPRRYASLNFPGDDRLKSVVYVHYKTAVRNYYYEDVIKLIKESPYIFDYELDKNWEENFPIKYVFDIDNYEQLQEVILTICQISKLYEEEQKYHDIEWMKKNPLCSFDIARPYENEDGEKRRKVISEVDITGLVDEKTIADRINNDYISKMKDGEIPWDSTIPGDAEGD